MEARRCSVAGCYPKSASAGSNVNVVSVAMTRAASVSVETAVCSNRGLCDMSAGLCQCFAGATGLACELQTILV